MEKITALLTFLSFNSHPQLRLQLTTTDKQMQECSLRKTQLDGFIGD
jgi:hypothetical protein